MKKFYSIAIVVIGSLLLTNNFASAQATNKWDGSSNNNWNTNANWSLGHVPTNAENVVIDINANINVDASPTINNLTVSANVSFTASGSARTITIDNTGSAISGTLSLNGSTGSGTRSMNIAFTGTNRTMSVSGTLNLNNSGDGSGYNAANSITTVTGTINNATTISNASTTRLIFSSGSTYQHSQNGGTIPSASWDANSTVNITGVTDAAPGGLNGQTFGHFTWNSNQNNTVTLEASFTVAGNMTISQTGNEDLRLLNGTTARTITVGGDFIFSATSTTDRFILVSDDGAGTLNVGGNFTKSGNSVFILKEDNGNGALNVTGNFSMSGGTFDQRSAGTGGTAIVSAGGFSLSGGTYDISGVGAVGVLNVAGDFSVSGSSSFTESSTGSGSVNFTGTTNYTSSGTRFANTINFTVNNGASLMLGANDFGLGSSGTFTLSSGAVLGIGHSSGITTTGTASNVRVTGNRTYNGNATYIYNGSASQITGSGLPATVTNLTINNSSPTGVTLSQSVAVSGAATFTQGILYTSAAPGTLLLTLNNGSTVGDVSNTSFVDGQVKKIGVVGSNFDFPVGKTGVGYMPIGIANVSGATTEFTAEYHRANPKTAYGSDGITALGIQGISACEYWTLNRSVTSSTADITMYWNAHSPCGSGNYVSSQPWGLRIVHFNTDPLVNRWDLHGGVINSGSGSVSGSLTWSGVNNFSPFALGALVGSNSSLPVMYDKVKAYARNSGVQVEWSNLTERDILGYDVEHSVNGKDFSVIAHVLPKDNNNDIASYSEFHATPATGTNYYRIKATEKGGKLIYTQILRVEIGNVKQQLTLYPNPVRGNQLTIGLNNFKQGQYTVRIISVSGADVYKQVINTQGSSMTETIKLPASVRPGMYSLLINGNDFTETKTFIVQ